MNPNKREQKPVFLVTVFLVCLIAVIAYALHLKSTDDKELVTNSSNLKTETNQNGNVKQGLTLLKQASAVSEEKELQRIGEEPLTITEEFNQARSIINDRKRREAIGIVAVKLAQQEQETAKELFQKFLPINKGNQSDANAFVQSFMAEYSKTDVSAALDWTGFLPDEVLYSAYQSLVETWASQSPIDTTGWLLNIPDSSLKLQLMQKVVGVVESSRSIAAMRQWADYMADNPLGSNYSGLVSRVYSQVTPQSAYDYSKSLLDPGKQMMAFHGMVMKLREDDVPLALDWAKKFPEENGVRHIALNDTLYLLAKENSFAAKDWLLRNNLNAMDYPSVAVLVQQMAEGVVQKVGK